MHKFIYVAATTLFTGSVSLLSAVDLVAVEGTVKEGIVEFRFEEVFEHTNFLGAPEVKEGDSNDQDLSLVEQIGSIPILTPQKVVQDSTSVADRKVLGSGTPPQSIGDALGAAYMKEKLLKDELARQQLEEEAKKVEEEEKKAAEERRARRLSLGSDLQDYQELVDQLLANNPIAGKPGVTLSLKFVSGLEATVNGQSEVKKVVPVISSPVKQSRKSDSSGNSSSRSGSDSGSDTDDGTHQIVLNVPL